MENKGKDHLAKRIGEPGSELDAIRMALELPAPESDDENYISDTSAEEGNEGEAIVVSISKGNGSEISEEDIGALRGCARIKGLIIREPAENPEPDES